MKKRKCKVAEEITDEGAKRLVCAIIKGVADDYRAVRLNPKDGDHEAEDKARKRAALRKWFNTPWAHNLCDTVGLHTDGCVRALVERYGE